MRDLTHSFPTIFVMRRKMIDKRRAINRWKTGRKESRENIAISIIRKGLQASFVTSTPAQTNTISLSLSFCPLTVWRSHSVDLSVLLMITKSLFAGGNCSFSHLLYNTVERRDGTWRLARSSEKHAFSLLPDKNTRRVFRERCEDGDFSVTTGSDVSCR